jgi:phosphoribosylanthranilate isomerase
MSDREVSGLKKPGAKLRKAQPLFERPARAFYLCPFLRSPQHPSNAMRIKASRITNLTDARYFAAKEVDYLGFNLEEGTEGYLDPMYMKAIREWVEGPRITGEFSRASTAYIREAVPFFGLDAIQVPAGYAGQLAAFEGIETILELREPDWDDAALLEGAAPFVSFFLVNLTWTPRWQDTARRLAECCAAYPVLIQTDAPAIQMPALLAALQPAGLGFVGGEEEKVGVKSFDEIEAIFEMLENR